MKTSAHHNCLLLSALFGLGCLGLIAALLRSDFPVKAQSKKLHLVEETSSDTRNEALTPEQDLALTSGAPRTGSISAPPTPGSGVLGATQYTIAVPDGASQLKIELSGNQDVDLFVRFGQRVTISGGQPVADYRSTSLSGSETITVTPSSSPPLQAGTYYIAIANFGPGDATFTVTATVTTGQPSNCPTVTGISPTSGNIGGNVTISGTNFTGVSAVKFSNNANASFTINSPTQITATVPGGAGTGPITISKPNCPDVATAVFSVGGGAQTWQGMTGQNLPIRFSVDEQNRVVNLQVDYRISFIGTGACVYTLSGATAPINNGQVQTELCCGGLGFVTGESPILRGTFSSPTTVTGNISDFRVGFATCNGSLILGSVGVSGTSFSAQRPGGPLCPTVSGINPASGTVGANVTITGANLTGLTAVKFANNVTASFTPVSDTQITARVPAGAATGPITLSKAGCSDVQTAAFTVLQAPTLSLMLTPATQTISAGGSGMITATISAAQNSATEITLASANPAIAAVPAGVTIPAGATSASFAVTGAAAGGPVMITATLPAGLGGASATAGVSVTGRLVRLVAGSGAPGGGVMIPIELVAQGDENALGFSLAFDPAILSAPRAELGSDAAGASLNTNDGQAAQGRFGISLARATGQTFAAGTRQFVIVSFAIAAATTAASTPVNFADQPIAREVSDANANVLPTSYSPGAALITTQGIETDVAPRPNGNGLVSVADWVQVGRFTAGLDAPDSGSEFQRADCAPRSASGNGALTVSDWVQAGRFAAGLDPTTPAGGPTGPAQAAPMLPLAARAAATNPRLLRAVAGDGEPDRLRSLTLELEAQGGENALGGSLLFNPAQWRFVAAAAGRDAQDAALQINTSQAASGRVGIALALPTGSRLAAGSRQLAVLTFARVSEAVTHPLAFGFSDQPVTRELADAEANVLAINYALDGLAINAQTVTSVSAASFSGDEVGSEAVVAAFGTRLATGTEVASTIPLPTMLAGTTVRILDSMGVEYLAPLLFISPAQVNYQIPPGAAAGVAMIRITNGDGTVSTGIVRITACRPGLFAANADGQGIAAAVALRAMADGSQVFEPVAHFDAAQNRFVARPIDLGPDGDQVFLVLYGTGYRARSSLATITCQIGGAAAEVLFAGPAPGLVGVDQSNVRLPRDLAGRGEVDVMLTVDGKMANKVRIAIR